MDTPPAPPRSRRLPSVLIAVAIAVLAGLIISLKLNSKADPPPASAPSVSPAAAAPAVAPPPAPVSTTATVSGTCTTGWEWVPGSTGTATGQFLPGTPPDVTNPDAAGSADPALAYQVALTDNSQATASVSGFAVAFYSAGTELGSDQEQVTGYITPGQSLTWTVIENQTENGGGDNPNQQLIQTSAIPAAAGSCQLVQWYTP